MERRQVAIAKRSKLASYAAGILVNIIPQFINWTIDLLK